MAMARYQHLALTEKRPLHAASHAFLRLIVLLVNQIGCTLDDLFLPEWRSADVSDPVFIIGHQRSGTTVLHRTLASAESLVASALWQMVFPSVAIANLAQLLERLDDRYGGHAGRLMDRSQDLRLEKLDHIHRLRWGEVEEDEFYFWAIFASAMCANDSPAAMRNKQLDALRQWEDWTQGRQQSIFTWYRDCLMKRIHEHREPASRARILAKNPAFSYKIPTLCRYFPSARFILLLRDPREAIPSRLALVRSIWRWQGSDDADMTPEFAEHLYQDSVRIYLGAERDFWSLPAEQRMLVRYEDLVDDHQGVVDRITRWLGVEKVRVPSVTDRVPDRASTGRVSMSRFGLDENRLYKDLAPVMQRHGYGSL
jgi:hypothetical protein